MSSFLLVMLVLTCACSATKQTPSGFCHREAPSALAVPWGFVSFPESETKVNFAELVLPFLSLGCFCFISRLLLTGGVNRQFERRWQRAAPLCTAHAALVHLCSREQR